MDGRQNLGTMTGVRALVAGRTPQVIAVIALAFTLVVIRSVVWIFFEQSSFDSDQAVVGLMAKHLAEGRAFPLFFYGQHYMLAVEAWLAAPVFRVAGASVAALKLPLLLINLVVTGLLLWLLVRTLKRRPFEALLISIFFVIPPPLVSARLVEAQGSNIEPFLYVLVLWLLRDRPIAFGLLAGFAFLHREFAAYAIAAIIVLDMMTGRAFTRGRLREYAMSWGMFALVVFVVNLLKLKADLLGPGTAGTINEGGLEAQISSWGQFVCWPPTELGMNLGWLGQENLGTIFNWKRDVLGPAGWSRTPTGYRWMAIALGCMSIVALVQVVRGKKHIGSNWQVGAYLMLVAVGAAFAYAVLGCSVRDRSLVRYTLLTIYFPIGLLILFWSAKPPAWSRAVVLGIVVLWGALSLLDNGRFLAAYLHRPPPSRVRELANYLESQGVRYARGTYWIAYQLDFLTEERLTVSSLDKVRVAEYQRIADEHDQQTVHIRPIRDWPRDCEEGIAYRLWCLDYFDRARNVARSTSQ